MPDAAARTPIHVERLTPDRWDDFAALCRRMGGNRGCWCVWWREVKGEPRTGPRRAEAQGLLAAGRFPGLLAYVGQEPVGWCALDRRDAYPRLDTTRDTAPAPDSGADTWVLPCFFVPEEWRHRGVQRALLAAALDEVARRGASAVEAVPVDPATKNRTASASYTGTLPFFLAAGFTEVARPTPKGRVLVRRLLGP
ncbi:GNAT family N-acetyltransferase [Streptomyces geranii]|uniref:GNAT family N-acetyltransferase n=1 Tax=Streptomyces geranii TaxID=2058923 RepID=UPI000D025E80|nr:GNAT family N-acetyltransferase [Streptomyces geranii]